MGSNTCFTEINVILASPYPIGQKIEILANWCFDVILKADQGAPT
jgi:phage-related minor tail protein